MPSGRRWWWSAERDGLRPLPAWTRRRGPIRDKVASASSADCAAIPFPSGRSWKSHTAPNRPCPASQSPAYTFAQGHRRWEPDQRGSARHAPSPRGPVANPGPPPACKRWREGCPHPPAPPSSSTTPAMRRRSGREDLRSGQHSSCRCVRLAAALRPRAPRRDYAAAR